MEKMLFAIAAAVGLQACGGDQITTEELVGEWRLTRDSERRLDWEIGMPGQTTHGYIILEGDGRCQFSGFSPENGKWMQASCSWVLRTSQPAGGRAKMAKVELRFDGQPQIADSYVVSTKGDRISLDGSFGNGWGDIVGLKYERQ